MEMLQNHLKWIYFTAIPQLNFFQKRETSSRLKGAYGASLAAKAIAIFAGQWPHSSYMIPFGVTSDPTYVEILQAQNTLLELQTFFEKECLGTSLENFLSFESCKDFQSIQGDIATLEEDLVALEFTNKGFAHDRFIVLGDHSFSQPSKLQQTRSFGVDVKYVTTTQAYTMQREKTYAKNALYKDKYYETGALARMIAQNNKFIKNVHRRYKDSAYSRCMARIFECAQILKYAQTVLKKVDVTQSSCMEVQNINTITALGVGVVEAPRGPLIHKVEIEKGIIKSFEIITPTQWNIGSDTPQKPTPVQQAMLHNTQEDALFIFRTFDVCSVCTTH
jgi:Ni,Fe-hydrogenase I large subunit